MGLLFIRLSSVVFDRHPNQGRRAWPLQSSWVVLEQETLTCCHPDERINFFLSFFRVGGHFFFFLLTRGSDQKQRLLKPETDNEILR